MCGIAGILRRDGANPADAGRLAAMLASLAHRGPDDDGCLLLDGGSGGFALDDRLRVGRVGSADVLLGNRRLAIVDLSRAGRQPMTNARRDLFVTFNGEIYNHEELRRELVARGHAFVSASDTEVVLHAYDAWGDACVERFNGMWAFAIWDQRARRLFCSRDRFGMKPFYYRLERGRFVFASEVKAILAASDERPRPHWPTVRAYLSPGALCHDDATFFEGIVRLPAAHNLVVTRHRVAVTRYWDYPEQGAPVRTAEEEFAALLDDAVRLRVRSEVPVGIALSGGIDSTATTVLARRHVAPRPLEVFTADFPGSPQDELRWATIAARHAGAELHVATYRPASLADDLARVVWHLDYPAVTAQVLPRWHLMQLAARHVKVIVEGQGSDEMLAGYPHRYFAPFVTDALRRARRGDVRAAWRALVAVARTYRGRGVGAIRALRRRIGADARPRDAAAPTTTAILTPDLRAVDWTSCGQPFADRYDDRLSRTLHRDHARDFLPQLLKFGDAISMGHALESRLPFLDHRVVELVFRLTPDEKFDGVGTKLVMRRALRDVLPPEILRRADKVGFATPDAMWLRASLASEVRPLLLSSAARERGIFERTGLERALDAFEQGDDRIARPLFRWLSLELWFRVFMDATATARPARYDQRTLAAQSAVSPPCR